MSKTTFILQEEDSPNFYVGRCTTTTLKNRVSQLRMGNYRTLHLVSSGELSESHHELLKRELQSFAITRGWYRIASGTHPMLLSQLDKFDEFNGVSERILQLVKRLQGNTYTSVLVDLTDALKMSRDMVTHQFNVLVRLEMITTSPSVQLK
jgi:hypothetical protein